MERTTGNGRETFSRRMKKDIHKAFGKAVTSMVTGQDDYMNTVDVAQQEEQREKVLVPVRCHKYTDEEELSENSDRHETFEIPRSWYNY